MTSRCIVNRINRQIYIESSEDFFKNYQKKTVKILLTQGLYAIIDSDMYDIIKENIWYAAKCSGKFYAVRNVYKDGRYTPEYMHALINSTLKDLILIIGIAIHLGMSNQIYGLPQHERTYVIKVWPGIIPLASKG